MTAGRLPKPRAELVEVKLNHEALAAGGHALNVMSQRSLEISRAFDDGLAYERPRLKSKARASFAGAAELMLEGGKALIVMKENEPHGEFINILGELGLAPRFAQKTMQAAFKYLSPALAANAPALAHLGKAKLLDLMAESDEDLAALADGGTLAGFTLEEAESMTTRELRAALKDRDNTLAARQKLLDKKDKKLQELEEKLNRPWQPIEDSPAKTAEHQGMLDALRNGVLQMEQGALLASQAAAAIFDGRVPQAMRVLARGDLEYLGQMVADLLAAHDLRVEFDGRQAPWVQEAKAAAGKRGGKA